MLGKLIKHEFKATAKTFALLYVAFITLTLLTKFCVYIPFENQIFHILEILLAILYVIALVGMSLFSFVLVLMRFNTNMLKDQGYLSNTLPVKMWQQITAKVITYAVWVVLSFIAMLVSLAIFFAGDGSGKVIKSFLNTLADNTELIPMLVFIVVILIVQIFVNILNCFAALSLGQIFSKHRVAGAVLFYFVLNYALGFLTSLVMVAAQPLIDKIETLEKASVEVNSFIQVAISVRAPMYAYLAVLLLCEILLGAIYYVITNFMLTKKLNLE